MSYLGDNLGAQIIALLQSNFVEGCCAASAISLVLFDHASTISAEIQFIWGRKLTAVTLLFYANRWITFAWAIMSAATQLIEPTSILVCTAIPFTQEALALLLLFLWAAFSSVRVYALSNGSWLLVFLVFLLAVVPFGMNIYGDYWDNTFQFVEMPFAAILCAESSTMSLSLDIKLATATRVCLITSDVIVLLTTWAKSFLMWRDARRLGIPAPLATMLLRDGTAYFA
ncbi:hypothetical protein CERSUDRAFT_119802 [Gelatoporia subvermispora B]|uniref:DUF6533 domain-containing protein n=1 Tax=Ceriporiopsis subvermispora (strain B) TaxID=914234 RepID=M2QZQ8_CERS8|nr:hypothetical protein CERSUDRAFT_119802 [Gelatoporia subvermispora B]